MDQHDVTTVPQAVAVPTSGETSFAVQHASEYIVGVGEGGSTAAADTTFAETRKRKRTSSTEDSSSRVHPKVRSKVVQEVFDLMKGGLLMHDEYEFIVAELTSGRC